MMGLLYKAGKNTLNNFVILLRKIKTMGMMELLQ